MADKVYIDLKTGKPTSQPAVEHNAQSTIHVTKGAFTIVSTSPNLKVVK